MKKTLATLIAVLACCILYGQELKGDWMRVRAEYKNGSRVPNNHEARLLVRYQFSKDEVFLIFAGSVLPSGYSRTGNTLKIEPFQNFIIENYSEKELTLLEADGSNPVRYFLIPLDSFQVSGMLSYKKEVVGTDTIFINAPGIEPIYKKGEKELKRSIITGITQKAAFKYSYVVKKDGTIGDVTIIASSNPKLDKRLIKLITKTSGGWIPGTYLGEPIDVRIEDSLSLSGPTPIRP